MNKPLNALIVEDSQADLDLLVRSLKKIGYDLFYKCVETRAELKTELKNQKWDIIFSDFALSQFNGYEALATVIEEKIETPFILISGTVGEETAVEAMRGGAKDYIMKDNLARLGPAVERELREAAERKVAKKKDLEHQRTQSRLELFKRFFAPQISDMIAAGELEDPFQWRKKDVSVLFVDLRGFTALTEEISIEEIMHILQDYYSGVGKLVREGRGSIGHLAGDGAMILFNDPLEIEDHPRAAVLFALQLRDLLIKLEKSWQEKGYKLSFGAGIASGAASIGGIGVEGCWDYSVVGMVANLASRLCDEAKNGQILISKKFLGTVEGLVEVELVGDRNFKGLTQTVTSYNILKKR